MKRFCIIMTTVALAACGNTPISKEELDGADYGLVMTERQCTDAAESHIRSTLKDPFSAQFVSDGPCHKGALKQSVLMGGKTYFGYLQTGAVNAKNSYGGYVGFQRYQAIIRNGIVVNYCLKNEDGICL